MLQEASLGTFLFDLLTEQEEIMDEQTQHIRFDIVLLANRLIGVCLLNTSSIKSRYLPVFSSSDDS